VTRRNIQAADTKMFEKLAIPHPSHSSPAQELTVLGTSTLEFPLFLQLHGAGTLKR